MADLQRRDSLVMAIKCIRCGVLKARIRNSKMGGLKSRYSYVGSCGKRWKSTICPPCASAASMRSRMKAQKKEQRRMEMSLIGEAVDTNPLTHRMCKKCNKPLRANRYYFHPDCAPIVTEEWDSEDWGCAVAINLEVTSGRF